MRFNIYLFIYLLNTNLMDRNFNIPSDTDFIRIVWCDNANIIRAKAIHRNLYGNSDYHVGISEAQQAVSTTGTVVRESGLSPVGEVQLVGDPTSFTSLPYSPGHGRMMGDMMKNGEVWDYCPRGFLKKLIKNTFEMGFSVKAAFENEFYLLRRNEKDLVTADNTDFASTYAMDINHEIIQNIITALIKQGLEVQQYYPESGSGQQEITIKYTDALKACDNQIAFRETVKAIAVRNGFLASFLPKIFPDKTGSGCHVHLSLWKDCKNILTDHQGIYGLSTMGEHFISGILNHLPALMAVTNPTPNSYRRIVPHGWTGVYQSWGLDNREAAVRVIRETTGEVKNFELKTVDASSNPYLTLGVIMAAGVDGIMKEMELVNPIQEDPAYLSEDELEKLKIRRLPLNLAESITELKDDEVILSAMGEKLAKAYIAVKEADLKELGELTLEDEVELFIEAY